MASDRRARCAAAVVAGVGLILTVRLDGREAGITLLTPDAYSGAIACGRSGADCAVAPYQLCPAALASYTAWIATPFSRVASSVFERLNRRQRPRPLERGLANDLGVGIYVSPKADAELADAIQRVVVKRAGRTIEPTTTTVAPITVGGDRSPARQLSRGYFAFPMETLSPGADVTIVLTGQASTVSCTLDRDKLLTLR